MVSHYRAFVSLTHPTLEVLLKNFSRPQPTHKSLKLTTSDNSLTFCDFWFRPIRSHSILRMTQHAGTHHSEVDVSDSAGDVRRLGSRRMDVVGVYRRAKSSFHWHSSIV